MVSGTPCTRTNDGGVPTRGPNPRVWSLALAHERGRTCDGTGSDTIGPRPESGRRGPARTARRGERAPAIPPRRHAQPGTRARGAPARDEGPTRPEVRPEREAQLHLARGA